MKKNSKILVILTALIVAALLQGVQAADVGIVGFNYTPAPASIGQNIQVIGTVTNNSSIDAENVVFKLVLSDENNSRLEDFPFILSPDQNAFVELGTIKAKESAIVQFSVGIAPTALNGNYTISMMAGDRGVLSKTKKFNIIILSRKPRIELISSNAKNITPGQETTIELTLKNVGSSNAINILAGIQEDRTVTAGGVVVERQIYPVGNSFAYIDALAPNESKTISLTLSANSKAESKTYTVPITLQWQDENRTDSSLTRYLGLRVVGEPSFDAIIDSVKPLAYPGGNPEVSITLFNAGIAEAQNIVVELSTTAGILDKDKIFIGTLDADDSDSFKTKIEISKDLKPGIYPINAKIVYKNSGLESRELIKIVNLRVVSQEESKTDGSTSSNPIVLIAAIIIIVGGFLWYRRRQNAKKNK